MVIEKNINDIYNFYTGSERFHGTILNKVVIPEDWNHIKYRVKNISGYGVEQNKRYQLDENTKVRFYKSEDAPTTEWIIEEKELVIK